MTYIPLIKQGYKVKHRLPEKAMPDVVTMGGMDEAYWESSGQFWEEDSEALARLRKTV